MPRIMPDKRHVIVRYRGLSAVFVSVVAISFATNIVMAQVPCQEVRFAAGSSSGTIEGQIPPDGTLCYAIKVGNGQTAQASIEGPEAQFPVISIPGVTRDGGDQSVTWTTRAGTYELSVFTMFRYGANTPFRLRLSVTGG